MSSATVPSLRERRGDSLHLPEGKVKMAGRSR
jgi:hypothetical protein